MQPHDLTENQIALLSKLFGIQAIAVESETAALQLLGERLKLLDHAHAVAERLIAEGFTVLAVSIHHHAAIRVKADKHVNTLPYVVKGRSHDGALPYVEFAAVVDGVAIEWKKPLTDRLLGIYQVRH